MEQGKKEDYLLAMERSAISDIEIKHILKETLTDEVDSRELYTKGIDHSYYEGDVACRVRKRKKATKWRSLV